MTLKRHLINARNFGLAFLVSGVVGCSADSNNGASNNENPVVAIGVSRGKICGNRLIAYNGMPNKERFSISHGFTAVNTYYPTDIQNFTCGDEKYQLVSVTPESLKVIYLGKN